MDTRLGHLALAHLRKKAGSLEEAAGDCLCRSPMAQKNRNRKEMVGEVEQAEAEGRFARQHQRNFRSEVRPFHQEDLEDR